MPKTRVAVPKATSDAVMKEFNHRCARCAADRPQIHHIDEDPSNNDPMNLIPLCPNCHLTDQHDPTRHIEPGILKLFRRFRDPTILKSQFQPLFNRLQFLNEMQERDDLMGRIDELVTFVAALEMGSFYSKQLHELIKMPAYGYAFSYDDRVVNQQTLLTMQQHAREHQEKLQSIRERIYGLIIELLRFQKW